MKNKSLKHYLVLISCCGLAGASIGISINTSGVFYGPVSDDLNILRGDFAMHMTIFSMVTALTSLFVPKIIKKVPLKLMLLAGIVGGTVFTGMMSLGKSLPYFYILGALRGICTAMYSAVTLTVIINAWFEKMHGLATSIVFSMSGLMGTILSPVLTQMIQSYGWQSGYIIKAGIFLAICLPSLLVPFHLNPQDDGLLPYGATTIKQDTQNTTINTKFNFLTIGFIIMFIYGMMSSFITGLTQHLPSYGETIGLSISAGALLLSAGMAGNITSKLVIGVLTDKFGALKASMTMMAINATGIILMMIFHQPTMMMLGAFLFGSCYSIGAVGLPLLTKYFFGTDVYNTVFPKISFAGNFGAAIALSMIGYIYDFFNSYTYAFIIVLIMIALGYLCLYISYKKNIS